MAVGREKPEIQTKTNTGDANFVEITRTDQKFRKKIIKLTSLSNSFTQYLSKNARWYSRYICLYKNAEMFGEPNEVYRANRENRAHTEDWDRKRATKPGTKMRSSGQKRKFRNSVI
uniref:Uncharacterized protein n=1 Tax=Strigamia maritima TaxID=126957 RepID=T1JK11_STRMM